MWHFPTSIPPTWGAWAVFASVLATQMGLPFPAAPMLILAGTMAALGQLSFVSVLCAAVSAVLLADAVWFLVGRLYGRRVLNSVVRFSLSLDNTVRVARRTFERFGAPMLAISKFVPGLALVSSPLMGTTAVALPVFLGWDFVGATLWSSFYLIGGALFDSQIVLLTQFVRDNGVTVVETLIFMAAFVFCYRWLRRWQFRRWLDQVRISPKELDEWLRSALPPVIFDARPTAVRRSEAVCIPGAVPLDLTAPGKIDLSHVKAPIVIYCVCPNEATAKQIVAQLHKKGLDKVRALKGGLDAWQNSGYPVEAISLIDLQGGSGSTQINFKTIGDVTNVTHVAHVTDVADVADMADIADISNVAHVADISSDRAAAV